VAEEIMRLCRIELMAADLCPECYCKEQNRDWDSKWFIRPCLVSITHRFHSHLFVLINDIIGGYFSTLKAATSCSGLGEAPEPAILACKDYAGSRGRFYSEMFRRLPKI